MQYTLSELKHVLTQKLKQPLPGLAAQLKMAPVGREHLNLKNLDQKKVKHAAVLALFTEVNNQAHIILTKRVSYLGVHSGQISFPGGKKENSDTNYQATALRETEEEIGVLSTNVDVLGALTPLYIPPSNFYVEPFLGCIKNSQKFTPQPREVAKILLIPFHEILSETNQSFEKFNRNNIEVEVPVFKVHNETIWGATAMMLNELRTLYTT